MVDGAADLVVLDVGLRPMPLIASAERAFSRGAEARMLLIVDLGGLATLSLPARGAIDFLVRGGSSEELAIRVRHLLWPGEEASSDDIVQRDGLTLNLATYQAMIDGQPIDFAYLEYALFAFLVTHPGRTYSREALLSRVWGTDYYGGSRTVDVHVRRIRAKLGPEHARRLETVRNVGYLWNG
jgi:DNA-binding response OmpR family regulator